MILLLIPAAACFAASAFLLVNGGFRRSALRASLKRAAAYGGATAEPADGGVRAALAPALARLTRLTPSLSPRFEVDGVTEKLRAAGLAGSLSPTGYMAVKVAAAAAGLVLGAFGGVALGGPGKAMVLAFVCAGLGFLAPERWLGARSDARREKILAELPNALDLLAVSVEAGLGLDAAVAKLTDRTRGPFADELALMLGEMRAGESRHDALRRLAERAGAREVTAFTRAVMQADELGVSLAKALRVQAADVRSRAQLEAEEKAGKAPVKMLFPTALFIFPALFVVVLGPALLSISALFH